MYTSKIMYCYTYNKEYVLRFRMTIATRGQTVGLDSADNQTNVQVSANILFTLGAHCIGITL